MPQSKRKKKIKAPNEPTNSKAHKEPELSPNLTSYSTEKPYNNMSHEDLHLPNIPKGKIRSSPRRKKDNKILVPQVKLACFIQCFIQLSIKTFSSAIPVDNMTSKIYTFIVALYY